jgi:hypothetical protein
MLVHPRLSPTRAWHPPWPCAATFATSWHHSPGLSAVWDAGSASAMAPPRCRTWRRSGGRRASSRPRCLPSTRSPRSCSSTRAPELEASTGVDAGGPPEFTMMPQSASGVKKSSAALQIALGLAEFAPSVVGQLEEPILDAPSRRTPHLASSLNSWARWCRPDRGTSQLARAQGWHRSSWRLAHQPPLASAIPNVSAAASWHGLSADRRQALGHEFLASAP